MHSAVADLAPAGGATIHAAKYLNTKSGSSGHRDEAELEECLDLLQPGWRDCVVKRRFMPRLLVSNTLVRASENGARGRPSIHLPELPQVFLAGDWVGDTGMLADAALASAEAAALAVLERRVVVGSSR